LKKTSQKNYWYFPFHARCFAVVLRHDVVVGSQVLHLHLRLRFLKDWQIGFLLQRAGNDGVLNLATLKDAHPPKSEWCYVGSYSQREVDWFEAEGVSLDEAIEILLVHGEEPGELVGCQERSMSDPEGLVQLALLA